MPPAQNAPIDIQQTYRPDIDGLRGLAILSVVAFHAAPDHIRGGFIGVDIFFVISGYLISKIIFEKTASDQFSLAEFYIRRIRRILPALLLVLFTCLAVGWNVLFYDEFRQLGKHVLASSLFLENILLWREVGYFDVAAESKTLLHLWSLSVEEQFYVFWPLLTILFYRRKWNFLVAILAVGSVSFITGNHLLETSKTSAFYLPVPRFWELMIGGLLAYLELHHRNLLSSSASWRSLVGLCLLIAGLVLIDKDDRFPGFWALLPVLGSFLVISSGPESWFNKRILSQRILVGTGLISYPLYLWHWSLLSFAYVIGIRSPFATTCEILIALCLSWATYHFIERQVRLSKRPIYILLVALLGTSSLAGGLVYLGDGLRNRSINEEIDFEPLLVAQSRVSDHSCKRLLNVDEVPEEVCLTNSSAPKTLIMGDSHAVALYAAIFAGRYATDAILVAGYSCLLYPSLSPQMLLLRPYGNNCNSIARHAITIAETIPSIRNIILASYGPYGGQLLFDSRGDSHRGKDAFVNGNEYLLDTLLTNKNVTFVIDNPHLNADVHHCVRRWIFPPDQTCVKKRTELDSDRNEYLNAVNELKQRHPALNVFDPTPLFCDDIQCHTMRDGKLLYFDEDHISIHASKLMLDGIFKAAK